MRIFVTGGAGFLGSHIVDALLQAGDNVCVFDNYSTGMAENVANSGNLSIVDGDIKDKNQFDEVFDSYGPDVVIHAAAAYKDPDNWEEDIQTNTLGMIHVVEASKRHKICRFVNLQTALCYGLQPLQLPIPIGHPYYAGGYDGGSSYAISKTVGEQYLALSGLDFVSFRLATALGPRSINGAVPAFYQRLKAGKPCFVADTRRDFLNYRDLVEIVTKAAHGQGESGYYNISSGLDHSIKEVFDTVVDAMGLDPALKDSVQVQPHRPDDTYSILLDPSKTQTEFEWRADGSLKEIIQTSVDYYEANGIQETYTHLRGLKEEK